MFRTMLAGLLTAIVVTQVGCTSMRENSRQMIDVFKPSDYADWTDDTSDPWVHQAGAEARGNQPRQMASEPRWFRELTMSPKARDIERNHGIYD